MVKDGGDPYSVSLSGSKKNPIYDGVLDLAVGQPYYPENDAKIKNKKLILWHKTWETQRLILFKTEIETVLILPGLFLREIIISSTSSEDTWAKNSELT